jgi:hypothetical protein
MQAKRFRRPLVEFLKPLRRNQEPIVAAPESPPPASKGRQSFSKLRRALSDEELASRAVQRMLVDEIERLETVVGDLGEFRKKYHEADRKCAVLEEKNNIAKDHEILYSVCLTLGAAAIGFARTFWGQQPAGYIFITLGLLLIVGGVASKVAKK